MQATGIVRKIDDLGRIVIPKEMRRVLRIRCGDPLEMKINAEGEIVLSKFSEMEDIKYLLKAFLSSIYELTGLDFIICNRDKIVAVPKQKESIYAQLERQEHGLQLVETKPKKIESNYTVFKNFMIPYGIYQSINIYGEIIGSLILVRDSPITENDEKYFEYAVNFLTSLHEER